MIHSNQSRLNKIFTTFKSNSIDECSMKLQPTKSVLPQHCTTCEAVDRQNSHRNDMVLVDICDNLWSALGAPASDQRRTIQEHWANVKRSKMGSCVKLLKWRGVEPSETTKRLLWESTMRTPPPSDAESETSSETLPWPQGSPASGAITIY